MKKTDLQRAIEKLEDERRVLDMAIARLKQQQDARPVRTRKPKPALLEVAK